GNSSRVRALRRSRVAHSSGDKQQRKGTNAKDRHRGHSSLARTEHAGHRNSGFGSDGIRLRLRRRVGVPQHLAGPDAQLPGLLRQYRHDDLSQGTGTQVDLAACLEDKITCNAQDSSEAAWNSNWLSGTRYATTTGTTT